MQRTHQRRGLQTLKSLSDELIWGTAALKHATSWQHVDDEGFGTMVTNMAGSKYWVVARHRQDSSPSQWQGSMCCGVPFREMIRPFDTSTDVYEHEGVLLTAGTVL